MRLEHYVGLLILFITSTRSQPILDLPATGKTDNVTAFSSSRGLFEWIVDDGLKTFQQRHSTSQVYAVLSRSSAGPSTEAESFSSILLRLDDISTRQIWETHNFPTALFAWSDPVLDQRRAGYLSWQWNAMPSGSSLRVILARLPTHGFAAAWDSVAVVKKSINPISRSLKSEPCYIFSRRLGPSRMREDVTWGIYSGRFHREIRQVAGDDMVFPSSNLSAGNITA